MRAGIQEETLRAMLEAGAVREVLVNRQDEKWGLAIRLGCVWCRWLPVRSRREALRTWASLTAVGRFAEHARPSATNGYSDRRTYAPDGPATDAGRPVHR